MVDFQSRDTHRAPVEDEADESEAEKPKSAAEAGEADERETKNPDEDAGGGSKKYDERDPDGPYHEEDGEHLPNEDADRDERGGHDGSDRPHDHPDHTHDHHAHDVDELGVGVLTVSSSRSLADDPAGDAIAEIFDGDGHDVVTRELVPDDYDRVQDVVNTLVGREDVDAVITTGGTGVTPDDVTVEAVRPLLDKELPGFGELFRRLSFDDIGTKVVATRAMAGVIDGVVVFCLPGSEAAVRLGTEEIIAEEAGHLAGLATREG